MHDESLGTLVLFTTKELTTAGTGQSNSGAKGRMTLSTLFSTALLPEGVAHIQAGFSHVNQSLDQDPYSGDSNL